MCLCLFSRVCVREIVAQPNHAPEMSPQSEQSYLRQYAPTLFQDMYLLVAYYSVGQLVAINAFPASGKIFQLANNIG